MDIKTILMYAMGLSCICASGVATKELTLDANDGLPCELTMVGIPGNEKISMFAIGKYEITQEQYEKIMGVNPSTVKGAKLPVNNVTWTEAMQFCERLNKLVSRRNLKWTLPTCDQWRHAAKGGADFKYPGSDDVNEVSWNFENSRGKIQPVGGKKPNGYGLYDMCGNVREWGRSTSGSAWHPLLGGSSIYKDVRADYNFGGTLHRDDRQTANGFRVVVIDTSHIERKIAEADKAFAAGLKGGDSKRIVLGGKLHLDLVKVVWGGKDCYLGRYEVTQDQYTKVMRTNPSAFKGGNLPVESVSWLDAVKFCETLNCVNPVRGMKWTLPSVELWKTAAEVGRGLRYVGGNEVDDVAWCCTNAEGTSHPVGQKMPNGLGLFDMSGNVAEWCLDRCELAGRTVLGGSWNFLADSCYCNDSGSWAFSDSGNRGVGFRACLVPEAVYASQKVLMKDSADLKIESKTVDLGMDVKIKLNKIPGQRYWFAVSELTQAQYESVVGQNPSTTKGANLPVENVSWQDALAFCEQLEKMFPQPGLKWTLPTTEQWNTAARCGQKFPFAGGDDIDEVGWFEGNSGGCVHPVCQKKPNAFGLYDMTGNVKELFVDQREGYALRFCAASSWNSKSLETCAIGVRSFPSPRARTNDTGFRVILVPADSGEADKTMKNVQSVLQGPYGIRMRVDPGCEKGAKYALEKLTKVYLPRAKAFYGDPFNGKHPSRDYTIQVKRNDGTGRSKYTGPSYGPGVGSWSIGLAKGSDKFEMSLDYLASSVLTVCEDARWASFVFYVNRLAEGKAKGVDPIPRLKDDIRKGLAQDDAEAEKNKGFRRHAPMWAALEELREKQPTLIRDYCTLKNGLYAAGQLPKRLSLEQMADLLKTVTGRNVAEIFRKYGVQEK